MRGQAALEYIMNYGFALILIIIVGVVLWKIGLFGGIGVSSSTGLNEFVILDHTVNGDTLYLALGKKVPEARIIQINIKGSLSGNWSGSVTITNNHTFTIPLNGNCSAGEHYYFDVIVKWINPMTGLTKVSRGHISGVCSGNLTSSSGVAWFYTNLTKRRLIDITENSGSNLYEYQVLINISYDADMQPDFDDIRFTYLNGSNEIEIPFYLEDKVDGSWARFWVKIPYIPASGTTRIYVYYGNSTVTSASNLQATFSYSEPRLIGYVVSDRIAYNGAVIESLMDNNTIIIGTQTFDLNEQEYTSAVVSASDPIYVKGLAQVEGSGAYDDIIVPISWAGTYFTYSGFRDSGDRFCMLSPFETADVYIYDGATLEWSGTVGSLSICVTNDITSTASLRIISTSPILVAYYGSSGSDAYSMYPATKGPLYGVPSQYLYIGAGNTGATVDYVSSAGSSGTITVNPDAGYKWLVGGRDGIGVAMKLTSNKNIGAIQQADSDGTESTTFLPKIELSNKVGSGNGAEYIAIASPYSGTCTLYNPDGTVKATTTLTGSNGIYKGCFNCGTDNVIYVNRGWKMECTVPVWAYYEEPTYDEETNLLSWKQMRQYIWPEPTYNIGSEESKP